MKIGIFLPVLTVSKYGYQQIYEIIIKNHTEYADVVYLRSNSKIDKKLTNCQAKYSNLKVIANTNTYTYDKNGNLAYNTTQNTEGNKYVVNQMRSDGVDIAINLSINQYIPDNHWKNIVSQCKMIYNNNEPYGYLYKQYQLGDVMFHADIRLPWIINLGHPDMICFASDSIIDSNNIILSRISSGNFRRNNSKAIVDVPFEMTMQDLREKNDFTKNYADLRAINGEVSEYTPFDEQERIEYYSRKMNKKIISKAKLDEYGILVSQATRPEYISQILLKNYMAPSLMKKIYKYCRSFI
jgi:hypothetical protein